MDDLSVSGPYSPASLKKFNMLEVNENEGVFKLLIPDESGIAMDDPDFAYITIQERAEQAKYFRETFFPDKLPDYLLQYLNFFYNGTNTMPTEEQLPQILGLIQYCDTNKEAQQLVGLITLFHDSLLLAKHYKSSVKLFIEEPETLLHPKRVRFVMYVLTVIAEKFDIKLNSR